VSALERQLREALDHAAAGDWQRAHEIVQEHEESDVANWIHALVHRMEGDLDNARYWYRRCGRKPADLSAAAEVEQIRAALSPPGKV
jgi:hypothetical protein